MKIEDLNDWIKKYFKTESDLTLIFPAIKRKQKIKELISKQIQKKKNPVELNPIKTLNTKIKNTIPLLFIKFYFIISIIIVLVVRLILSEYLSISVLLITICLLNLTFFTHIPNKLEISQSLSIFWGVTFIGYIIIVLVLFIIIIIFIVQIKINKQLKSWKKINYIRKIIFLFCFLRFSAVKIFYFFLFFELSLIPMFLVIIGWGYQPERIKASLIIIFYTLFSSLPLLIILICFGVWGLTFFDHLTFLLKSELSTNNIFNNFFSIFVFLRFLVKLPIFILHLWLPQAHVEAPASGRIILASVLLKLGGYGIIRLNYFFSHEILFCKLIFIIGLLGGRVAAFICLQQVDLKVIVAYSSIVHMALILSRSLTNSQWGNLRAILILFRHGFSSSGLFWGVNISYEMTGSRRVIINKGILQRKPIFIFWWAMLCVSNMGRPPTMNFFGEILSSLSLIIYSCFTIFRVFLFLVFSAFYNLNLYSSLSHGEIRKKNIFFSKLNLHENLLFLAHLFPVLLRPLTIYIFS